MKDFIVKYWLEAVFGVLAGGVGWCIKRLRTLKKRQNAIELGIQALLRDRLVQAYYYYTKRGDVSLHGLEAVDSMYKQYHALGGNGPVTQLVDAIKKLKVVDD